MGQECEFGAGVHMAEDLTLYEVADEDNRPPPPGEVGAKLLMTTLTNRTLPLVRYELTDIVAWSDEPCFAAGHSRALPQSIAGARRFCDSRSETVVPSMFMRVDYALP